jgi:hypothetical protein
MTGSSLFWLLKSLKSLKVSDGLSWCLISVERLMGPCGQIECVSADNVWEMLTAATDALMFLSIRYGLRVDWLCVWRQHVGMTSCMLQLGVGLPCPLHASTEGWEPG